MVCFGTEQFGKQMDIGPYSGTLMCTSLYVDKNVERKYCKKVMLVSAKEFHTYTVHIFDDMKDSSEETYQLG